MFFALLAKDLRRARHNPIPWLTNLAIPLCITALIGLAFGSSQSSGLGHIKFAVVDEDHSVLGKMLQSMTGQGTNAQKLEPVFMDRTNALAAINNNEISAVLIIPEHFTKHYLTATEPVSLELIKNPAESVNPAVLEELLGAGVTGLSAVSRNFHEEFSTLQSAFDGDGDFDQMATVLKQTGEKLKSAKASILPPLVSYTETETETKPVPAKTGGVVKTGNQFSLFGYLLLGMSAMFLLFLAGHGMSDLQRELRNGTLARYHTLNQPLLPFIASKVAFTLVMLLAGSVIMLGGGALIFRFQWQHPLSLAVLMFSYTLFAACLMALLTALVADERRANMMNNLTGMLLGMAGGCTFPAEQLPLFVQNYFTHWMPSYWFVSAAREVEFGGESVVWWGMAVKLGLAGVVCALAANYVFRRKFRNGLTA